MRLVDAPAEEDELELAAAVRDRHLQALATARVELQYAGGRHLGHDRDVLVQREVGEAGELAPLGVAAGVVVQQVAHRVQVEVLGHDLGGGLAEGVLQRFLERVHEIHCTPRH